jgi:hypothetical protein
MGMRYFSSNSFSLEVRTKCKALTGANMKILGNADIFIMV